MKGSQPQRAPCYTITFIWHVLHRWILRDRKQSGGSQGWGNRGSLLNGHEGAVRASVVFWNEIGKGMHSIVRVLGGTESFTATWFVPCDVKFTSIVEKPYSGMPETLDGGVDNFTSVQRVLLLLVTLGWQQPFTSFPRTLILVPQAQQRDSIILSKGSL